MNKLIILVKGLLIYPPLTLLLLNIFFIGILWHMQQNKKSITRAITFDMLIQSYKIPDIRKTLVLLIMYFLSTIGILLVLRIINIGHSNSLFQVEFSIPFINVLILISFLLLLALIKAIYYPKVLKEMFTLYLYVLTLEKGKYFIEFIFDKYHNSIRNEYITDSYLFLMHIRPDQEIPSIVVNFYDKFDHLISLKTIYYMRNKLQQSPTLHMIVRYVSRMISLLDMYWWPLRHYFIYVILYCTIIYDLIQEVIYYTYFILPIVMLISLYRKFLSFIGTKDFYVLDPILSAYIYEKGASLEALENNERTIREYLSNGYRGEHASYFFTEKTLPIVPEFVIIKRLSILVIICIASWTLLFNMTLTNTLLLTIPLALSINTMEYNHTIIIESKKLFKKIIFNISIVSMLLINTWVYLTRHNYYYLREVLWNKGIIIKQNFTIEEKADFLYKYLNYTLDKLTDISEEVKGMILSKVTDANLIYSLTEDTTIQQIRDFVEQLPFTYLRLENFYNRQFVEILSKAREIAQDEFDEMLTRIWSDHILLLIIIVGKGVAGYLYFTNKSKDIILFTNTMPKKSITESIKIFMVYLESFYEKIMRDYSNL